MDRSGSRPDNVWAVVAIPSQEDYVWRLSSEKIPHLTILALNGDGMENKISQMSGYLEHVLNTSLYRFGLEVDHRGVLGEEDADVLFFAKNYETKTLEKFRSYLLKDQSFFEAYNSMDQYPSWTPHLTLGYPTAPAKPDPRDSIRGWVDFDRVALWTGDFEGPEFRLKNYEAEDLSMTDNVEQLLKHHGVLGMRWGVRRTKAQLDAASEDAASARATAEKIKKNKGRTDSLSNKELQDFIARANLEKQFAQLKEEQGTLNKGEKKLKKMLGRGKTIQEIYNFARSPLGKDLFKLIMKTTKG